MFPWRIRLRHNITARYIRFLIKDWVSRPIPQLELYGCEGEYKFDWLSKLFCFRCWCSVAWSLVTIVVFLKKPPFPQSIECFHMTSRRPCWCPKTKKWRPCWFPKLNLWELNSIFMQKLSFVSVNQYGR